jgi:hypothetical protein
MGRGSLPFPATRKASASARGRKRQLGALQPSGASLAPPALVFDLVVDPIDGARDAEHLRQRSDLTRATRARVRARVVVCARACARDCVRARVRARVCV